MGYKCFLQILGCAGEGGAATPSLMLFLDNARYVFGCGEGTQRLCAEAKTRLAKVTTILLTKCAWDGLGGLPGSLLTQLADERRVFDIVAPAGGTAVMAAFAGVLGRSSATYRVWECGGAAPAQAFDDSIVHVDAIALVDPTPDDDEDEDDIVKEPALKKNKVGGGDGDDDEDEEEDSKTCDANVGCGACCAVLRRSADGKCTELTYSVVSTVNKDADPFTVGASETETASETKEGYQTVRTLGEMLSLRGSGPVPVLCYVCRLPDAPGKFDARRATALGVPAGPERARLVRGETVVLADGRTVAPHECLGAPQRGRVFAIVDCPSDGHAAALVAPDTAVAARFAPFVAGGAEAERVRCVVHLTPRRVVCGPQRAAYAAWCTRFAPPVVHVFIGAGYPARGIALPTAALVRARLHPVDPIVFPLPPRAPNPLPACPELAAIPGAVLGEHRAVFDLSAGVGGASAKSGCVLMPDPLANKETLEALAALEEQQKREEEEEEGRGGVGEELDVAEEDIYAVTFLGTGSSAPSKQRNVSAVLLRTARGECVLVDCGENTYGQLCDHFGAARARELVAHRLSNVVITHLHADHHLGLLRLLLVRAEVEAEMEAETGKPQRLPALHVTCTETLAQFYRMHGAVAGCAGLVGRGRVEFHTLRDAEAAPVTLPRTAVALQAVRVDHCHDAHAVVLAGAGWRVACSGDCRPCAALAALRPVPNLLVHEATFAAGREADARAKKHSTVPEAVAVATAMRARFLLLTHFSQRYARGFPALPPEALARPAPPLMCAFDHMTVTQRSLPRLPSYIPILQELFKDDVDGDDGDDEGDE